MYVMPPRHKSARHLVRSHASCHRRSHEILMQIDDSHCGLAQSARGRLRGRGPAREELLYRLTHILHGGIVELREHRQRQNLTLISIRTWEIPFRVIQMPIRIQERQRGWIVNGRIDSALGKELLQSVSALRSDYVYVIDVRSTRTHARQHQITDALERFVVACGDAPTLRSPRSDVFQLCAQQTR